MKFTIITIFPELFESVLGTSILKRALQDDKIIVDLVNPRDFATDKHSTVDDAPYGGGQGMVMKVEPIVAALNSLERGPGSRTLIMSARGERLTQPVAQRFADSVDHLIMICGRYEGIDERVMEYVDGELSIGDFVLTGGELGAAVVVDSVARLLPGVLGHELSAVEESHSSPGYLEHPHYTRPEEFDGKRVPAVLMSGDHAAIAKWRMENAASRTRNAATPTTEPESHQK